MFQIIKRDADVLLQVKERIGFEKKIFMKCFQLTLNVFRADPFFFLPLDRAD